jgi:U4/U6 small nuclear ribonucleoprotein PRP31
MHDEVQKKITKILEPPPVKAPKPLPKPDDPIRKKRGGRRYA